METKFNTEPTLNFTDGCNLIQSVYHEKQSNVIPVHKILPLLSVMILYFKSYIEVNAACDYMCITKIFDIEFTAQLNLY